MPPDGQSVAHLIRLILRRVPAGEQEEAFTHLAEVLAPEADVIAVSAVGDVRMRERSG